MQGHLWWVKHRWGSEAFSLSGRKFVICILLLCYVGIYLLKEVDTLNTKFKFLTVVDLDDERSVKLKTHPVELWIGTLAVVKNQIIVQ